MVKPVSNKMTQPKLPSPNYLLGTKLMSMHNFNVDDQTDAAELKRPNWRGRYDMARMTWLN